MAIKLADTTRPNNYTDSSSIGTFPVAYAENVWLNNGADLETILGNLEVEPFRVTEMPLASVSELGNYYLYTGEDGTYKSGHLYECYCRHLFFPNLME